MEYNLKAAPGLKHQVSETETWRENVPTFHLTDGVRVSHFREPALHLWSRIEAGRVHVAPADQRDGTVSSDYRQETSQRRLDIIHKTEGCQHITTLLQLALTHLDQINQTQTQRLTDTDIS